MALYFLSALIAVACLLGASNWRHALFMMVLIAAMQDPLRKLIPGTPGYLVLASMPVLGVAIISMVLKRPRWWKEFGSDFPKVGKAVKIFGLACIPAAIISATYGPGSWMLTILGAFSYGVLIFAVLVGFYFCRSLMDLRRLLGTYCVVSGLMLTGGLLEYLQVVPDLPILGTKMLGMEWIRNSSDFTVNMMAGFYRSPDVMGWHAATTVMMSMILAFTTRGGTRWFWISLGMLAVVALLLCGRRKMVFMIPFFLAALTLLHIVAGRKGQLLGLVTLLLIPVLTIGIVGDWLGDESTFVRYYTENSGDTLDQLQTHGFISLFDTVQQSGFFGSGLGVATPGSHHLQVARPRVWQESGPSRIMVELGVPGFLAFVWMVATILKAAWNTVRVHLRSDTVYARYALGLMAFFMANVGSLVVSGQILADSFIAFFLGFSIGVVLSFGRTSIMDSLTSPRAKVPPRKSPQPMASQYPGRPSMTRQGNRL